MLLTGCTDGNDAPVVTIEIVSRDLSDPTAGASQVSIRVQEENFEPATLTADVIDGEFALELPVLGGRLRATVELTGSGQRQIGATPTFLLGESVTATGDFLVRVAVAESGTCAPVAFEAGTTALNAAGRDGLSSARSALSATQHGTFGVFAGGLAEGAPVSGAGFVDLLQYTRGDYATVNVAGETSGAALSTSRAVLLGAQVEEFRLADGELVPVAGVPAEVGPASGIRERRDGGAVIAGGSQVLSRALLWLDEVGAMTARQLNTARVAPAVAALQDGFLIAGGAATGPVAEWVFPNRDPVPIGGVTDGTRIGGTLLVTADGSEALLLGGKDEGGNVRQDTVWFQQCDVQCVPGPGPTWVNARDGAAQGSRGGFHWIVGGDLSLSQNSLVEAVRFAAAGPVFESVAQLASGRSRPALLPMASGVLYVVGGETTTETSTEIELCVGQNVVLPGI